MYVFKEVATYVVSEVVKQTIHVDIETYTYADTQTYEQTQWIQASIGRSMHTYTHSHRYMHRRMRTQIPRMNTQRCHACWLRAFHPAHWFAHCVPSVSDQLLEAQSGL